MIFSVAFLVALVPLISGTVVTLDPPARKGTGLMVYRPADIHSTIYDKDIPIQLDPARWEDVSEATCFTDGWTALRVYDDKSDPTDPFYPVMVVSAFHEQREIVKDYKSARFQVDSAYDADDVAWFVHNVTASLDYLVKEKGRPSLKNPEM